MKIISIIFLSFLVSGCASAVMKSGCGHISGAEITVPYVGGKANGNAYGCYMGCVGMSCKAPSYSDLSTVTTEYIKDASKDNAINTTSPGTITFTPAPTK